MSAQVKGWLHTPIEDETTLNEQVKRVCQLYHDAPKLHADNLNTHLLTTRWQRPLNGVSFRQACVT